MGRLAELRPEHARSRRRNDTVYVPSSSPVSPKPSTRIERDAGDGGGSDGGGSDEDDEEDDDGGDSDDGAVMRIFRATWYNRIGAQSETSSSSSRESVKTARIEIII